MNDSFLGHLHTSRDPDQPDVFVARGEGQYLLPEAPFGSAWIRRFDSTREDPFEERVLGREYEGDPVRQIATLYGPAGVAVYELVKVDVLVDEEEVTLVPVTVVPQTVAIESSQREAA